MLKVAILDDYQNVSQQFVDLEKLSGKYEFKIFSEPFIDESDALDQLADFEALLIMRERTPMTKNLIDNLSKLKFIITSGLRNRSIDLEAAKKRNITVTNTPEVLTDATAEIGILLILGACRRASEGIEGARAGDWKWSADYLIGKQLTGSRLGILGMGRIGQKIAKIAKSLGMIIHYHNRSKLNSEKEQGAIYHEKLESLLSVSDVLSVCCPASKETINLINKDSLELLPKGAVVTNVARGDIVDDEALIDALNRRKVYAVGLDVYKNEPNLNPGYLKHKSAFILPHLGSATKETRTAMANLAIDNLTEFFQSGSCKNKVN